MNVSDALRTAGEQLEQSGVSEPRREAVSLLAFVLGRDRTYLFAHPEYELKDDENSEYIDVVARRSGHEPFQYIVGKQEFCGLEFAVNRHVLIPRPETEILVEIAIERLKGLEKPRFLEIGVGSGCIALSILKSLPSATAVGGDISQAALDVARRNAASLGVEDRIELIVSDVYSTISAGPLDAVVANPPYVPSGEIEGLQSEVRLFEPHIALTDGGDGLSIIERTIAGAHRFLKPNGFLLIEIGFSQSDRVKSMYDPAIWLEPELVDDHQGIPRIVVAGLKDA